jgi:proteasome accessory factor B
MPSTKLQRWLDLIAFLVARRFPVTVEQILEGVPAYSAGHYDADETKRNNTRRKFERDKAELREAGIPIESVHYEVNYGAERMEGYRLSTRDFHLPYLRLLGDGAPTESPVSSPSGEFPVRADELRTVLTGLDHIRRVPSSPLSAAAASALRKLAFDLPVSFPAPPQTLYLDPPGGPDPKPALEALSDALSRRKTVTFRYHGIRRTQATDRRVDAYGLMFRQSRWYLVGWDRSRDDERVFRVSRMQDVRSNRNRPETPDYEVPADFDLRAYAAREAWDLGRGRGDDRLLKVRVHFRFPRSLWADRNGHGVLVEEHDDGSTEREFEVTDTGPLLRWLLPQADEATIQLPAELHLELRRLAARVADAHAGGAP